MKKYELVLMVDPSLKEADRKSLIKDVQTTLGSNILDTDDIGLKDLVYDLGSETGKNRAYFVSYCIQGDNALLAEIKKSLLYNKGILRYALFALTNTQPFHHFEKITKELEKTIDSWEGTKFGSKLSFYADDRNQGSISWKSIPMLQKYMTRFGNIKPRKYTNNPVNVQKKVRIAILRAREFGLLHYLR